MRVVIDTNVVISSLFWGGAPRRVVDLAAGGHFQALTSPELLAELEAVLAESFGIPQEKLDLVLRDILSYAEVVTVLEEPQIPVRDLSDTKVLACAIAGHADCIVTGDHDLLALDAVRGIRTLSVRAFLDAHSWPD
jgi:putative PIN family toxin of toxin-antitoxin system